MFSVIIFSTTLFLSSITVEAAGGLKAYYRISGGNCKCDGLELRVSGASERPFVVECEKPVSNFFHLYIGGKNGVATIMGPQFVSFMQIYADYNYNYIYAD